MTHLIYVNIMVILMDVTLLGTEYSGHYEIQTTYKAAVCSVKLKMEFSILNQLPEITQGNHQASYPRSSNGMTLDTFTWQTSGKGHACMLRPQFVHTHGPIPRG
jgi:hypothetical protein